MNPRTKKYLLGGLLVVLVSGAVSAFVFAAGSSQTANAQQAPAAPSQPVATDQATTPRAAQAARFAQLTDEQKAELKELQVQMMTLRQKMISKYQEFGVISADRANYMKDQIELQKKYAGTDSGVGFGGMMGGGPRGMMRGRGRGPGMMYGNGYNQ